MFDWVLNMPLLLQMLHLFNNPSSALSRQTHQVLNKWPGIKSKFYVMEPPWKWNLGSSKGFQTIKVNESRYIALFCSADLPKSFSQLIWSIFIFSQHFFNRICPVEKGGVTPYCLYRDSLILNSVITFPIKLRVFNFLVNLFGKI